MKRVTSSKLIAASALVLLCCGNASAEDFRFGVGVKTWYNDWKTALASGGGTSKTSEDPVFMVGPSLKASYGKVFAGTSYLVSTSDYKTDISSADFPSDTLRSDRKDLDVIAGYMLHPSLSIFAGYKYIKADLKDTYNTVGNPAVFESSDIDRKIYGPAVGFSTSYAFSGMPLSIYGNAAYMMLKSKFSSASDSLKGDSDGFSLEAGANYNIYKGFSASAGYKYQKFTTEMDDSSIDEWDDVFKGFTLGANYSF